jgi:hypothetical protein
MAPQHRNTNEFSSGTAVVLSLKGKDATLKTVESGFGEPLKAIELAITFIRLPEESDAS